MQKGELEFLRKMNELEIERARRLGDIEVSILCPFLIPSTVVYVMLASQRVECNNVQCVPMYCMYCMYCVYCVYCVYCMYCMYCMYCVYCMYCIGVFAGLQIVSSSQGDWLTDHQICCLVWP